jgi:hypothetical protein
MQHSDCSLALQAADASSRAMVSGWRACSSSQPTPCTCSREQRPIKPLNPAAHIQGGACRPVAGTSTEVPCLNTDSQQAQLDMDQPDPSGCTLHAQQRFKAHSS